MAQACKPSPKSKALPVKKNARKTLAKKGVKFAGPAQSYPMPDAYHAKLAISALNRVAGRHGTGEPYKSTARRVLRAVKDRFPGVYICERDLVQKVSKRYGI